jgi:XRE family aerobic/anaerobic benzoate catabolism transcriptional regulator
MEGQNLLTELGRRLREARGHAGLTVSDLADRAGLSRRYVTEAEAGRANLSILKLAALAQALRTPLAQLLDLQLVSPHSERIALVGLRGAGKSSVGRELALRLEVPFVELDAKVEELAGMPLSEIFSLQGEEHFHRLEAEALESVLSSGERLVLATGGSIVASPANFERLRATCRTVWLRAQPEEHLQRVEAQGDRRPMQGRPRALQELKELLARREPLYARCEIEVETSGLSVPEVVAAIERRLAG